MNPSPREACPAPRGIDKAALSDAKTKSRLAIEAKANNASVTTAGSANTVFGVPIFTIIAFSLLGVVGVMAFVWRRK